MLKSQFVTINPENHNVIDNWSLAFSILSKQFDLEVNSEDYTFKIDRLAE